MTSLDIPRIYAKHVGFWATMMIGGRPARLLGPDPYML